MSCTFDAEREHKKVEKHPRGSAAETILAACIAAYQLYKAAYSAMHRRENLSVICLRQSICGTGRQLGFAARTNSIRRSRRMIPGAKCRQQKNREEQQYHSKGQPSLKTRCSEIDTHIPPPFSCRTSFPFDAAGPCFCRHDSIRFRKSQQKNLIFRQFLHHIAFCFI